MSLNVGVNVETKNIVVKITNGGVTATTELSTEDALIAGEAIIASARVLAQREGKKLQPITRTIDTED